MSNEVVVVKLSTGEELISRCEFMDETVILNKPHILMQVPGPNGQVGFGLAPWIMAGNIEYVTIKNKWVITTVSANSEVGNMYLQQVTGLTLGNPSNLEL